MRSQLMKPLQLYAARTPGRQQVLPALMLAPGTWDWLPQPGGEDVFRLVPEKGAVPVKLITDNAGGRRGVLAAMPPVGTKVTGGLVHDLKRLARAVEKQGLHDRGEAAVPLLQEMLPGRGLRLDVVQYRNALNPWEKYVSEKGLVECPLCSGYVPPAASGRLRAHPDDSGAPCDRSNTALTVEERAREQ